MGLSTNPDRKVELKMDIAILKKEIADDEFQNWADKSIGKKMERLKVLQTEMRSIEEKENLQHR